MKHQSKRGPAPWGRRPFTGFTLVETLFAILVLTISIAGPLTIASRGLNASLMAKDKTIAIYLAQDAVEYVRFARDTNRLADTPIPWLTGLDTCVSADGSKACTIDSISDTTVACGSITTCPVIQYNAAQNTYTYGSGANITPSIYTRTISIISPVGGNSSEAAVKVNVTWKDVGSIVHSVALQENLLDWQQ